MSLVSPLPLFSLSLSLHFFLITFCSSTSKHSLLFSSSISSGMTLSPFSFSSLPSSLSPFLFLHWCFICFFIVFPFVVPFVRHLQTFSFSPNSSFSFLHLLSTLLFPITFPLITSSISFFFPVHLPVPPFGLLRFQRYKWRRADCFQGICL